MTRSSRKEDVPGRRVRAGRRGQEVRRWRRRQRWRREYEPRRRAQRAVDSPGPELVAGRGVARHQRAVHDRHLALGHGISVPQRRPQHRPGGGRAPFGALHGSATCQPLLRRSDSALVLHHRLRVVGRPRRGRTLAAGPVAREPSPVRRTTSIRASAAVSGSHSSSRTRPPPPPFTTRRDSPRSRAHTRTTARATVAAAECHRFTNNLER